MRPAFAAAWSDLIARRAADLASPNVAFRFLSGDATDAPIEWSFSTLDRHARAIAATLIARGAPGERVVLPHPPGVEFVAAFLGCLYAGATAVPTFAPRLRDRDRTLERFAAILDNARPALVLTTADARDTVAACVERVAPTLKLDTLSSDTIDLAAAADYRVPNPVTDLACLQYTSGTSGVPKGVMLSNDAFLANSAQIAERFGSDATTSHGVIWLPPHHDMGLMGGLIHPMLVGFGVTLMAPATFLQRPTRWLEAVSKYRGTISGGPCFAYALALDSIGDDVIDSLDLSCWHTAFCGAERVRPGVMRRFADRFARAGFKPAAITPCYGMAEATLMLTSTRRDAGLSVDDAGLVDCGPVAQGVRIAVIDPASRTRVAPGAQGEIWVRSPALASGYFGMPEQTARTFGALIIDEAGPWLRTGDLGYVSEGGGYVITGRLKDLIIVRGVNHAPDDLEAALTDAHEALQPHAAAAFAVESNRDDAEQVVIVAELRREARNADGEAVARAVRAAVTQACEVEVGSVVLLRPGSIPRTTSGKVQRGRCRELFVANELDVLHTSQPPTPTPAVEAGTVAIPDLANADRIALTGQLTAYVRAKVASIAHLAVAEIDPAEPLARYNIGSADAVGLAGTISNELNIDLPAMVLWDYPTIAELVNYVIGEFAPVAASIAA